MKPILKNILAVVVGIVIGNVVNMGIIMISGKLIPPPPGAILTTEAGLKAAMPLMQPIHFLMPFLAHALGTLVGAFVSTLIASNHKIKLAIAIGFIFLLGGASMVYMLPSPMWFNITDLVGAYIPMALIGYWLANIIKKD